MTEKETPIEIVEMEMELSRFLKKGVNKITREGGLKDDYLNKLANLRGRASKKAGKPRSYASSKLCPPSDPVTD